MARDTPSPQACPDRPIAALSAKSVAACAPAELIRETQAQDIQASRGTAAADCPDGFDDFDWGGFDMECQAACEAMAAEPHLSALSPKQPSPAPAKAHEGSLEHAEGSAIASDLQDDLPEVSPSSESGGLEGKRTGSSQLMDCKTTNKEVQIHRCAVLPVPRFYPSTPES